MEIQTKLDVTGTKITTNPRIFNYLTSARVHLSSYLTRSNEESDRL